MSADLGDDTLMVCCCETCAVVRRQRLYSNHYSALAEQTQLKLGDQDTEPAGNHRMSRLPKGSLPNGVECNCSQCLLATARSRRVTAKKPYRLLVAVVLLALMFTLAVLEASGDRRSVHKGKGSNGSSRGGGVSATDDDDAVEDSLLTVVQDGSGMYVEFPVGGEHPEPDAVSQEFTRGVRYGTRRRRFRPHLMGEHYSMQHHSLYLRRHLLGNAWLHHDAAEVGSAQEGYEYGDRHKERAQEGSGMSFRGRHVPFKGFQAMQDRHMMHCAVCTAMVEKLGQLAESNDASTLRTTLIDKAILYVQGLGWNEKRKSLFERTKKGTDEEVNAFARVVLNSDDAIHGMTSLLHSYYAVGSRRAFPRVFGSNVVCAAELRACPHAEEPEGEVDDEFIGHFVGLAALAPSARFADDAGFDRGRDL